MTRKPSGWVRSLSVRRVVKSLGISALLGFACAIALPVWAQSQTPRPAPQIEDNRLWGEGDKIQRRLDWFFSTRRAGTDSFIEMSQLRGVAIDDIQRQIAIQARSKSPVDGGNAWTSMGPSPSTFGGWAFGTIAGRVAAMTADWSTGTLYVGSASGGLWKSTNDGASWTHLFDTAGTQTVGAVEVDPNDSNVIWAGTGENVVGCESYFGIGLLRSTDGGVTWEARNGSGGSSLESLSSFANVIVDPRNSSRIITGGRQRGCDTGSPTTGGIYLSTDAGATWSKQLSATVYEIQQDPNVLDTFWAATSSGVYKSTDNAQTWIQQTASGLPSGSTSRTELTISPSDSNTVYALFNSPTSFWRTTNGGSSWEQMSTGSDACDGQCTYNMVIRADPNDPTTVYRGTIRVWKSTNSGANWSDLSNGWGSSQKVHQDTHVLLMDPNNADTFYVGSDGGVWKSINGGASFTNVIGDMNLTQFYAIGVHPTDSGIICGGAQDNSSLARTTSNTWDLQEVTGDGFVCHIDPVDTNRTYIASYPSGGFPNVRRSTNGLFGPFSRISGSSNGINSGDRSNWVTPYTLDPTSPNIIYLGTNRLYKSLDYGDNFTQSGPNDMTNGGTILSIDVNRNFPDHVLVGTNDGKVWRTTDGGANWTDLTAGLPGRSINDLASDPTNPNRFFVTLGGFNTDHLYEWTTTTGWTAISGGLPNVPTNTVLMLTDQTIFVGNDVGVYRSDDGGITFLPFMNNLPEGTVVTDLKYTSANDTITAGTYGRGAWQVIADPIGPLILFDSYEQPLVEIDGDGDTDVEPGETWKVSTILRNAGSDTAGGVTARLATQTPGVTILADDVKSHGDIDSGQTASAVDGYTFVVDPSFACGGEISFDVVDMASSSPVKSYTDVEDAFTIGVVDEFGPPVFDTIFDENFDAPTDWTSEFFDPGFFFCQLPYVDEWNVATKDAAHGQSYHLGNGPGGEYSRVNYAWLYHGGKDSTGGPGIDVPATAQTVTLTVEHWYDTQLNSDGGQVLVDGSQNGADSYTLLTPLAGYPAGTLQTNRCNGLEGQPAFHGNSGGWITSQFDLTPYIGQKIYLAFVFGSDSGSVGNGEGWYIDNIDIETETPGTPICQIAQWPGAVPPDATFVKNGGDIDVSWAASCNIGDFPGQSYSIQAGDLSALASSGTYSHATLGGDCARTSPQTITPTSDLQYFVVVPNGGLRDGSVGSDSTGLARPQLDATCGTQRVACP